MKMKQDGLKNMGSMPKYGLRTPIEKRPIAPYRIRKISGSFAFIEHRFLRDGFWASLDHHQLLLYLFLVMVADRNGLSYYSYDKICMLLSICVDEYILARDFLIDQDLIAFDGRLFQVLSLPQKNGLPSPAALTSPKEMAQQDPATIHQLIKQSLGRNHDNN
ncbi:hypothetical protein [Desulfobacula sp.]|uniref:hypothetical protein n=1 Tax=Desulfobacula sp. TaxID=2593537 RepID=UPI002603E520|nr:hypothetical protein [Desulfobacula sp.]